jgi:hypothetical protein
MSGGREKAGQLRGLPDSKEGPIDHCALQAG